MKRVLRKKLDSGCETGQKGGGIKIDGLSMIRTRREDLLVPWLHDDEIATWPITAQRKVNLQLIEEQAKGLKRAGFPRYSPSILEYGHQVKVSMVTSNERKKLARTCEPAFSTLKLGSPFGYLKLPIMLSLPTAVS